MMFLAFLAGSSAALEQPEFELIDETGELQIRKYEAHVVARTLVKRSFSEAGNQGFKRLGGYIFGGNHREQKIAMTAPVGLQPLVGASADTQYWVTFSMPNAYSVAELPVPNDNRVDIVEVPERYMAVLRYKGSWSEERYRTHETRLLSSVEKNPSWEKRGEPYWARYDPPFMPWFMRTNEVAVEVVPIIRHF